MNILKFIYKKLRKMGKILIIVDCQNDFIDGTLAVPKATDMIGRLGTFLAKNAKDYDKIMLTADWHPTNHSSFVENNGAWPAHCVQFTQGAAIHNTIINVLRNAHIDYDILTKGLKAETEEYSILANENSKKRIIETFDIVKPSEIHVCGIAGSFCVKNTVEDLVKEGFGDKVNVLLDFVADFDNSTFKDYLVENKIKFSE